MVGVPDFKLLVEVCYYCVALAWSLPQRVTEKWDPRVLAVVKLCQPRESRFVEGTAVWIPCVWCFTLWE